MNDKTYELASNFGDIVGTKPGREVGIILTGNNNKRQASGD